MTTPRFARLRAADLPAWWAAHPDALVLDARDAVHHARGAMPGSLRLDGRNHERLLMREAKSRPVLIYCYHGNASQTYAEMFSDFGFQRVADLMGGWEAWVQSRLSLPPVDVPQPEPAPVPDMLQAWLASAGFTHPEAVGPHGNTPLMQAAWRGQLDVIDALLSLGVSLTATNGDGNNALWLGCVSNQPEVVRRLAAAGVPIDHVNLTGATSLMYAASSGKPEIVSTLLALGADPFIQTQDDFTALDMAANLPCLQLLRAATRGGRPQAA